eukprot:TRINITY_DN1688_c0_g1_i1.p1 TRINITY_DN1688_c0_g1~~TRINITY_DN1688_c0_g1_i1.p1  ORF type:complete len:349 (-),score=87.08 TRINITY_DN1688_c0_g1_i1:54-1100(-)
MINDFNELKREPYVSSTENYKRKFSFNRSKLSSNSHSHKFKYRTNSLPSEEELREKLIKTNQKLEKEKNFLKDLTANENKELFDLYDRCKKDQNTLKSLYDENMKLMTKLHEMQEIHNRLSHKQESLIEENRSKSDIICNLKLEDASFYEKLKKDTEIIEKQHSLALIDKFLISLSNFKIDYEKSGNSASTCNLIIHISSSKKFYFENVDITGKNTVPFLYHCSPGVIDSLHSSPEIEEVLKIGIPTKYSQNKLKDLFNCICVAKANNELQLLRKTNNNDILNEQNSKSVILKVEKERKEEKKMKKNVSVSVEKNNTKKDRLRKARGKNEKVSRTKDGSNNIMGVWKY